MCEVITAADAGTPGGDERRQLARGEPLDADVEPRQPEVAVGGGRAVAGEVLDAGGDAGDWRPATPGGRVGGDAVGVRPELRVPMTGLSGSQLTSATGARSRSIPAPAQVDPDPPPDGLGQVEVVHGAERGGAASTGLPSR